MTTRFLKVIRRLSLCGLLMAVSTPVWAVETRPMIWVTPDDRAELLQKIEQHDWAASLYTQLRQRADQAVARHQADRDGYLKALPLDWSAGLSTHPKLRKITSDESDRYILMPYLQDAIDCGIVYYLSEETEYAQCAADVMGVVLSALSRMTRTGSASNGGLVYPNDHLKEARIFGAQIPVAYDFIYAFVANGTQVYDVVSGGEREFPYADAQKTFSTYVDMAINVGHTGSNWSVLESSSLVGNILAMDTEEKRQTYLPYYLTTQSARQDPLSTVAQKYPNPGDIWPESLQYSRSVAEFSTYLMLLLDRLYPDLNLAGSYPNIIEAMTRDYLLKYPNGDVISFGDGQRNYDTDYVSFEVAYGLAEKTGNTRFKDLFGSLIKSGMASRRYIRGNLSPRSYGADIYRSPVQLLWSVPDLAGEEREYPKPRTDSLPFAGIYLQRSESVTDTIKQSLMAFVGGGSYVHGHATGMNIELYGRGSVLGIDPGPGTYTTEIHENYYRLFAAHNTVISNGASASSGGWVNLGIKQLELVSMEPMPNEAGVSPYHSFTTTRFQDAYNMVAPAEHERTLALIRTSDSTGYYVDVFRARSNTPGQYHDYVYHNVGEKVDFIDTPDGFALTPDPNRYQASASLPWSSNSRFRHPGWHYFTDVLSSGPVSENVTARFDATGLGGGTTHMKAFLAGGSERTYTKVMGPTSKNAPSPYPSYETPAILVRQEGEAWSNPFAVVYEPSWSLAILNAGASVQRVDSLMEGDVFKGLIVESIVDGALLRQYVLVLDGVDSEYSNTELGISFRGNFGVVTTDENGELQSLYIGSGNSLQYGNRILVADPSTGAGYQESTVGSWVDTGDFLGWLEASQFPFVYSVSLSKWLYMASNEVMPPAGAWIYVYGG